MKVPAGYVNVSYASTLDFFRTHAERQLASMGYSNAEIARMNNAQYAEALKQAQAAALAQAQAALTADYTQLGEVEIPKDAAVDGFYTDSRHIVCRAMPYLTVPLQTASGFVGGFVRNANPGGPGGGTDGGAATVPEHLTRENLAAVDASLGGGEFVVGAAMDLSGAMGRAYCTRFWDGLLAPSDLTALAGARELYAEIYLPYNDTRAKCLVCKVVTDMPVSEPGAAQGGNLTVYPLMVPAPVLCLADYAPFFGFAAGGAAVGTDATFPWAASHYIHTRASISGFGPRAVLDSLKDGVDAPSVDLAVTKWPGSGPQGETDFCRVRLCVESAERAKGVLNRDVPIEFCGFTEGALNVVTAPVTGADSSMLASADTGTSGQIYIPKDKLAGVKGMTDAKYERCLHIMGSFENASADWKPEGLTVDCGGVSWGTFQTTQGAGGLQKCLQMLMSKNPGPRDTANIEIIKRHLPSLKQGSFGNNGQGSGHTKDDEFCTALKNLGKGIDRNLCIYVQSEQWANEYYLPAAIKLFNDCTLSSPAGLLYCMYSINAGVTKQNRSELVAAARGGADEKSKLQAFSKVRRAYLTVVGKRNGAYSNYMQWCNAIDEVIRSGDLNLDQQHRWKDGLVI